MIHGGQYKSFFFIAAFLEEKGEMFWGGLSQGERKCFVHMWSMWLGLLDMHSKVGG